jgi:hypothetical protein
MELKHDYQEPNLTPQPETNRLESISGTFPYVTSAPTWTPKTFRDSFAIYKNGTTYRLYVYDHVNNAWRAISMT